MNRRQFLSVCGAVSGIAAVSVPGTGCTGRKRRPNILIILADDLGYGDLGCYGAEDIKTPHIDGFVSEGMKFTRFYANCPVCSPTRAALLSGRYPEMVGVPGVIRTHPENSWGHLIQDAALLPGILRNAGYQTALVGKWHLGLETPDTPNERGFDLFHGFLGDMMDDYSTHRRHGINYMRLNAEEIDPEGHATDLFSRWAADAIRSFDRQRPFFLYLAYNAPHVPLDPPEEWLERVRQREAGRGPQGAPQDGPYGAPHGASQYGSRNSPGWEENRARLAALIEQLDDGIGQVLGTLDEEGYKENTLVIFTSDNGGQVNIGADNGPLRGTKGTLYEGGIRVPMGAAWPLRIPSGSVSDRIALTMDIFPTVLEAAGIRPDAEIEGKSFLETLQGGEQPLPERDLFFGRREGPDRLFHKAGTIHCIRRGDWKLVQHRPDAPFELYDLKEDPLEEKDLSRERPGLFHALSGALEEQIRRYNEVPWKPPGHE